MQPDTAPTLTVTQADRDAAASYAAEHWLWPAPVVSDVRRGGVEWDAYHLTQAFARHRVASAQPTACTECERLAEALQPFVDGAGHTQVFLRSRQKMHPTGLDLYAEDVARASNALASHTVRLIDEESGK